MTDVTFNCNGRYYEVILLFFAEVIATLLADHFPQKLRARYTLIYTLYTVYYQ